MNCYSDYATAGNMTSYPSFVEYAYSVQQYPIRPSKDSPITPHIPNINYLVPKGQYYKYQANICNPQSDVQPISFPNVGDTYDIYVNQALPPHAP